MQDVMVSGGIYSVQLGAVQPLESNLFDPGEIWLEMAVDNTISADDLADQAVTAAALADHAITPDKLAIFCQEGEIVVCSPVLV